MRYKSVLIISYGRSGSTLLQGILNTLPNFLVRGENYNFCWGLYLSWRSLIDARLKFGNSGSNSVTSAWYGANNLNPEDFLQSARNLLRQQILGAQAPDEIIWGFKEIRYLNVLDDLEKYIEFMSYLMPDVAIIFNIRNHDSVCSSGFWQDEDSNILCDKLKKAENIFFEYAYRNHNAIIVRYEDVIRGVEGLQPMFDFLGIEPDSEKVISALKTPHSYMQKKETLSLTKEL